MVPRRKLLLVFAALIKLVSYGAPTGLKKATSINNSGVTPEGLCGTWVKQSDGGSFTSPNYPEKYPPDRECTYIIEASPRQCIDLYFDERYSIEPSWECKFDHIEVRDGPFSYSPIIGRYCGQESPVYVRSTGRYLWIKFVADGELEAIGFSARYNFTPDPDFKDFHIPLSLAPCEFEMSGPEGIVESALVMKDGSILQAEAVDCRWFIRAPPGSKIYLRFLEYEMQNSNECKRNFVAVYDGSGSVEHLKNKFCSTVANDVILLTAVGVVRMWADEGSRTSRFRMLFTTFREPPCDRDAYFCHSNMCINHTLVCNGIQNCVYPWDENGCKEKRKATILETLDRTNVTIIGVTCGVVFLLLTVSVVIQVKQPRTKYILRRDDFDPALLPEAFEPFHYELCTLPPGVSPEAQTPPGTPPEAPPDTPPEAFPRLQRSFSRCVHGHHCGSHTSSVRGSCVDLSLHEAATVLAGMQVPPPPPAPPPPPPLLHHASLCSHRSMVVMKRGDSQDHATEACELDSDLEDEPTIQWVTADMDTAVHGAPSSDF